MNLIFFFSFSIPFLLFLFLGTYSDFLFHLLFLHFSKFFVLSVKLKLNLLTNFYRCKISTQNWRTGLSRRSIVRKKYSSCLSPAATSDVCTLKCSEEREQSEI